ncbi:MAG: HD domain-containing phosphohydrolase [Pseudomonadota bacterium]
MQPYYAIEQNSLGLKLTNITHKELLFLREVPCDIYSYHQQLFKIVFPKYTQLDKSILQKLAETGLTHFYVLQKEKEKIITNVQTELINVTRSLSIGDPVEKGRNKLNLLSINMAHLYSNPTDDNCLNLQFQCAKNLCAFLYENHRHIRRLFEEYTQQKHFYVYAQPMISSLLLLGLLRHTRLLTDKEIEMLFLTSYFKDIGMSAVPEEQYSVEDLSDDDKKLLLRHPRHSIEILAKRLPLRPSGFKIIEHHHAFSGLTQQVGVQEQDQMLFGFETMIISVMDIISAMTSERPYRSATNLFDSLNLVKVIIADQFPAEFKLMVNYFKTFYST